MAFNIGAGLAEAGKSIAASAQAYGLESQKAELEKERLTLADQLAGAREEKGRIFQTKEREATQAFTGGENEKNRTQAKELAQLAADTSIKTAGISAGATLGAARMNIDARHEERRLDRAEQKPLLDAEVLAKSIANTNQQMVQDARKEIADARASGDPARIKAAQQKEYDATYSSQSQVQQTSLYQAQAKLIGDALQAAQAKLVAMQDPVKGLTPEGKAMTAQLQKQVDELQRQYMAAVRAADEATKNLPAYNPGGGQTGAPDLSKYMKPSSIEAPPRPQGIPMPPGGLINQPIQ